MSLQDRQWNFSALAAAFVLLCTNSVCGAAFVLGKISFEQWAAAAGSVNSAAMAWVARGMVGPTKEGA